MSDKEQGPELQRSLWNRIDELRRDRKRLDFLLGEGWVRDPLNDTRVDTRLELDGIMERELSHD